MFRNYIKPTLFGSWYKDNNNKHSKDFLSITNAKKRSHFSKSTLANELIDDNRLFHSLVNLSKKNTNFNEKFNSEFSQNFTYNFKEIDVNFIIPFIPLRYYTNSFLVFDYFAYFRKSVKSKYLYVNQNNYLSAYDKPFSIFENINNTSNNFIKLEQQDTLNQFFFFNYFIKQNPFNYYKKNSIVPKQQKVLLF